MTHADDLRAWARGMYTIEAATELLIRAFGGSLLPLVTHGSIQVPSRRDPVR